MDRMKVQNITDPKRTSLMKRNLIYLSNMNKKDTFG